METAGSIVDKLMTVNLKIIHNISLSDKIKLNNLNDQRIMLEEEVDDIFVSILKGKFKDSQIIRPQHKTY